MKIYYGSVEFFEREIIHSLSRQETNSLEEIAEKLEKELLYDFICDEKIKRECLNNLVCACTRVNHQFINADGTDSSISAYN
ncbi:hypothetical protein J7I93_04525 [Bacillus sp. ISL-47]|uniref:hypothetical protein n=1 Tax=Bacillus sp. ISL-47 TaxID=2819130 RepID=UPI001BE7B54A|nr:hypothetical protein [Bacillus sp. ISL-47]MBT2687444.1 hypothetical protein [Bacillus sp. ISL-47]MBT2707094.1 hypothetical protein [Pseudomonas sp. ISL-84]